MSNFSWKVHFSSLHFGLFMLYLILILGRRSGPRRANYPMFQTSHSLPIGWHYSLFSDQFCILIWRLQNCFLLFQKNVHSTKIVTFMLDQVFPRLDEIKGHSEGSEIELLRVLAELSGSAGQLDDADAKITPLFSKLMVHFALTFTAYIARDIEVFPVYETFSSSRSAGIKIVVGDGRPRVSVMSFVFTELVTSSQVVMSSKNRS